MFDVQIHFFYYFEVDSKHAVLYQTEQVIKKDYKNYKYLKRFYLFTAVLRGRIIFK